ncbi:MAG TPA: class I SAM-dependent methyltransferase, partial [Arenibaculum sp.]|nr:class I SAM-dependent methyltransferase [Arenibaculum sp.]
ALGSRGLEVVGTDASAPLIEAARRAGGAEFHVASYGELAADPARAGSGYDVAVANFALLDEDMDPLLASLRRILVPGGALVVQTVHPASAGAPYRDGWRTEDFAGFGNGANGEGDGAGSWRPMPWYFRTLGSWLDLLRRTGYGLTDLDEPVHPETQLPLSLLMTAQPA